MTEKPVAASKSGKSSHEYSLRAIAGCVLLLILAAGCGERRKADQSGHTKPVDALKHIPTQKVDSFLTSSMNELHIPGLSVAVVQRGKLAYTRQYGLADVEHSIPVTPESPFKIASLTKPITVIAILQLVDRGDLSLGETLGNHLPKLPEEWHEITVRQLLSHTSGLADYFQAPDWSWRHSWRLDLDHSEFVAMCAKSPMVFEPGEKMKYCNTGYYLLGMLVEKASRQPYGEYIGKNIFEPLGMLHSRLDRAQAIIPNRVNGYTLADGRLNNAEFTADTWAYSEGGVVTTAADLARLDSALLEPEMLSNQSFDLMWTPSTLRDGSLGVIGDNGAGKPNHYGMGWFISDYKGHKVILAGGNKPGYTCIYFRFPERDLSVILLTNLSSAPLYTIAGELAEMYLQE